MKKGLHNITSVILPGILNSYSVIFFFNNRMMAVVLMLVTFFNFYAGLSGLVAASMAVVIAYTLNLDHFQLKKGLFSFNALLLGIGMGTYFEPGAFFFCLLALATLISLILTVTLGGWLNRHYLPVLSIPFVISFWFVLLPSGQFENLGLTQRNIYWMNEMYSIGGNGMLNLFLKIDSLPIGHLADMYLRALSSIFFQSNLIAGFLIAVGLLVCSRISFTLSVLGFLTAYAFAQFSGSETASITYYNIGANYMMVALAIGGFFSLPSRYSYWWTVLTIPITTMVLLFFTKLMGVVMLPVFSLPFSIVVILFIHFMHFRTKVDKLHLTPFQYYSPEINLYTFENNNKNRFYHFLYQPLYLPFWGEWTVSQGYDGAHTHKAEWGKALDFVIKDEKGKTYTSDGSLPGHYYCYNKPVLAPADGWVEDITDNIDDNEIGKTNTINNWGNSIIIRHKDGLYTQLSHLKKGSFKVSRGNYVKRGDVIACCGNSGRSPEPHIHFQVQNMPVLGAKTIEYPISYFLHNGDGTPTLKQFSTPQENERISGVIDNVLLKNAFDIIPGSTLKFKFATEKGILKTETWEAITDAYNNKYLYCKETDSSAYYINDGLMFYFTAFYGNRSSLLYYFYLTAYKVFLGEGENLHVIDAMPLSIIRNQQLLLWIHDFIAPFHQFLKVKYSISPHPDNNPFDKEQFEFMSTITVCRGAKEQCESNSSISIKNSRITGFTYERNKHKITATCENC